MTEPDEHFRPLHVTQETINRYAQLSGDFNPLHVDPEAGARSIFGSTIAHGPIALQVFFLGITSWLGEESLPIGSRIDARFRAPVRPGDTITCVVLHHTSDDLITAECRTQDGTTAVILEARIPGSSARSLHESSSASP